MKGANPSDLPVRQPTKLQYFINPKVANPKVANLKVANLKAANLKAAKALGLKVSPTLGARNP